MWITSGGPSLGHNRQGYWAEHAASWRELRKEDVAAAAGWHREKDSAQTRERRVFAERGGPLAKVVDEHDVAIFLVQL